MDFELSDLISTVKFLFFKLNSTLPYPVIDCIIKYKVYTNQACQGSYEKTIYTGKKPYVSPNPVGSNAKIFLPYHSSKIKVNLYNVDGDYLDSRVFLFNDETKSFDWQMEEYLPGIYLMNIITEESEFTVKIVKK